MPTPKHLTTLLATAALAVATGAAGCGGGGDPAGGGTEGGPPPAQVVASGDPAAGKKVFADNCAACHGADGGGVSAPGLREEEYKDAEVVVSQIRDGGGGMPAFGDQLSEQELADVSSYVTKDLATK
jgi:cytochrome c551